MLAIADFARELGVHSIGLSKLRVDKFTPLRQLVESTPGYRISSNGHVYSQEFDYQRLRKIRNRIRNRFMCRPGQVAKILSTLDRGGILTYSDMARLGLATPLFLWDYLASRGGKALRRLRNRFAPQDA